ncbi:hypothetical protein ACH5RR_026821 [Cinchona calisaya]|uniref:Uncharacterized protein n=1 Tax=Cinchona calisaya TaxID=153742 RepID=A0ABD2Z5M9_9GENT
MSTNQGGAGQNQGANSQDRRHQRSQATKDGAMTIVTNVVRKDITPNFTSQNQLKVMLPYPPKRLMYLIKIGMHKYRLQLKSVHFVALLIKRRVSSYNMILYVSGLSNKITGNLSLDIAEAYVGKATLYLVAAIELAECGDRRRFPRGD